MSPIMATKKPDRFTMHVPDEQEPEREMPIRLEVVDYKSGKSAGKPLGGGAYDPYQNTGSPGDTARSRKPRVDLRQLSEWIKTTQQVKALREEDTPPEGKSED
jgi:hypothetical protein